MLQVTQSFDHSSGESSSQIPSHGGEEGQQYDQYIQILYVIGSDLPDLTFVGQLRSWP